MTNSRRNFIKQLSVSSAALAAAGSLSVSAAPNDGRDVARYVSTN